MCNKVPYLHFYGIVESSERLCECTGLAPGGIMSEELQQLIEATRNVDMTPAEQEEQRRSFAFGNANIENQRVTRETVARAAQLMTRGK